MTRGVLLCVSLTVALVGAGLTPAAGATHHRVGLIRHDAVKLRARPTGNARVLATLIEQTQVEVTARKGAWSHVRIWASIRGWVPSRDIVFRKPWASTSTYHAPTAKYGPHPSGPYPLTASATLLFATPLLTEPGGRGRGVRPSGSRVTVTAWLEDASGAIWYRINNLWASGSGVQFSSPDPGLWKVHGAPLWRAVAGKGMWLTLGTVTGATPDAIVRAAHQNGITHIYLEAAISPLGFHGRQSVGPLIEAAHQSGISVLAWVYPYLDDLASDVMLTRAVAAYQTPSHQRFDGIAADLERNMDDWRIRAYSQLIRRYVGNNYPLVGVSYPPQSIPTYPFAVLARSYNAIAPMDYWHQTKTGFGLDYGQMAYGYGYGYRYALDSVSVIRKVSGHVPVTTIGQTFDDFGRLEMGPHAPSRAELNGFLKGSKDAGAIGASCFQWMTATDGEWRAIHDFRF